MSYNPKRPDEISGRKKGKKTYRAAGVGRFEGEIYSLEVAIADQLRIGTEESGRLQQRQPWSGAFELADQQINDLVFCSALGRKVVGERTFLAAHLVQLSLQQRDLLVLSI